MKYMYNAQILSISIGIKFWKFNNEKHLVSKIVLDYSKLFSKGFLYG